MKQERKREREREEWQASPGWRQEPRNSGREEGDARLCWREKEPLEPTAGERRKNQKKKKKRKRAARARDGLRFIVCNPSPFDAYGHTAQNTPRPIRTVQLSWARPVQYRGGGPRGKCRCCRLTFFLFSFPLFVLLLLRSHLGGKKKHPFFFWCMGSSLVLSCSRSKQAAAAVSVRTSWGGGEGVRSTVETVGKTSRGGVLNGAGRRRRRQQR